MVFSVEMIEGNHLFILFYFEEFVPFSLVFHYKYCFVFFSFSLSKIILYAINVW